jgi:hypothetical protein
MPVAYTQCMRDAFRHCRIAATCVLVLDGLYCRNDYFNGAVSTWRCFAFHNFIQQACVSLPRAVVAEAAWFVLSDAVCSQGQSYTTLQCVGRWLGWVC